MIGHLNHHPFAFDSFANKKENLYVNKIIRFCQLDLFETLFNSRNGIRFFIEFNWKIIVIVLEKMNCLKVPNEINKVMCFLQCLGNLRNRGKILIFIFYASLPLSIAFGALNSNDRDEFLYLMHTATTVILQVVKLFYIIWRWEEILSFLSEVNSINIEYVEDFNRVNEKLTIFQRLLKYLSLTFFLMFSLMHVSYATLQERTLCCAIAFPLDWRNDDVAYWLALTYLVIETVVSYIIVLFNFIIWYIMLMYVFKYELLGNQFRRMGIVNPNEYKDLRELTEIEKQNLFCQDFHAAVESYEDIRE